MKTFSEIHVVILITNFFMDSSLFVNIIEAVYLVERLAYVLPDIVCDNVLLIGQDGKKCAYV